MWRLDSGTHHGLRLLLCRIARSRFLLILTGHILRHKRALRVAHRIMAHLLVAAEIRALKGSLWGNNLREDIRIEFVFQTVPEQFLAGVHQSVDIADSHSSPQVPEFLLVEIPRGICLYIGLYMEVLVKLFEEDTLFKSPA